MSFLLPLLMVFILIYSAYKKVDIYNEFIIGVKEGVKLIFEILPSILTFVFAIELFLKSNVLSFLCSFFPFFSKYNIPLEVVSLALMRPVSGNASLAILVSVYKKYGVDSFWGYLSSIFLGCTDTTLYVLALYFGSVKITKTKYALSVGLFADFCGIVAAIVVSYFFFT